MAVHTFRLQKDSHFELKDAWSKRGVFELILLTRITRDSRKNCGEIVGQLTETHTIWRILAQ
jgi:hypothetical protein